MPRLRQLALLLSLVILTSLVGCLRHQPEWRLLGSGAETSPMQLDDSMVRARNLTKNAGDRVTVMAAEEAWREVLDVDPSNFEALVEIGDLELLMGAAYSEGRAEQRQHYLKSLTWSERALYTLPAFRERIDAGEPLWIAAEAVGPEGFLPMIKWVTSVFYLYGDSLSSVGKVLNVRWLDRCRRVLTHMSAVDPDWEQGLLQFTWGIFHVALPPSAGGDRVMAAEELERAIALNSNRLLFRWGRGRYFYYETGNRLGFVDDLKWVVAQDLKVAGGPYAWNVYLQRDARRLLDEVDERFR